MPRTTPKPVLSLNEYTSVAVQTVQSAALLAVKTGYSDEVRNGLESCEKWCLGWYSEGVASGLYVRGLQDELSELKRYLETCNDFSTRVGAFVGIGLAIMNKGVFVERFYETLNCLEAPWVFDGVGFQCCICAPELDAASLRPPQFVEGEDRTEAFFAGVGRALWFRLGEQSIEAMANFVESAPSEWHPALWRGIGFGSTYAGCSDAGLEELKRRAGKHLDYMKIACGYAQLSDEGEGIAHRERAAQIYTGVSGEELRGAMRAAFARLDARHQNQDTPTWREILSTISDELER